MLSVRVCVCAPCAASYALIHILPHTRRHRSTQPRFALGENTKKERWGHTREQRSLREERDSSTAVCCFMRAFMSRAQARYTTGNEHARRLAAPHATRTFPTHISFASHVISRDHTTPPKETEKKKGSRRGTGGRRVHSPSQRERCHSDTPHSQSRKQNKVRTHT